MIHWAGRQEGLQTSYGQRLWGLLYPWLLYQGISLLVTFVFAYVMVMRDPDFMPSSGNLLDYSLKLSDQIMAYYLPLALATCLLTIPLLLYFFRQDRLREQRESFRMEHWGKNGPLAYLLCAACGISASVVLNHVLIYSGLYVLLEDSYAETAQVLFQGNIWMELLSVGLLSPVTEELIFRGLIFRRIRWHLDGRTAMVLSALIFAVFHGNLLQGIYAFLIGLLLAYLYESTHSLLAPICVHVSANVVSVLFTDVEGLNRIYLAENETVFLLLTGAMMLVFTLSFYLFYTRMRPAPVEQEEPMAGSFTMNQED